MDDIGKHIVETQDRKENIDLQLAANTVYRKAKILRIILFSLALPFTLLLAYTCNQYSLLLEDKEWILASYAVCIALINQGLESAIRRLTKTAASIQEVFDTRVLKIEINPTLDSVFIDDAAIYRYSKKAKLNAKLLESKTTWYDKEVSDIPTNIASVLCQRANVSYDFSLRARYQSTLIAVTTIAFICLLLIALTNNLSVRSLLIEVVIPGIPLLIFAIQEISRSKDSSDNLLWMKEFINEALKDGKITLKRLRQIQDRIFAHRVQTPLIPEFVYERMRTGLEDQMNYSIASYISENLVHLKK